MMNLTQKLGVEECIEFVGKIGAESVVKNLLDAHVCVVPSAMEGASATLCEAMYLGVPSIAAYRGGMTELLRDKESGFYYDFPEYSVLAQRIMEIFENDLLAEQFSKQVQDDASARHNREKNVRDMIEVYKKILEIERVADKVCLN